MNSPESLGGSLPKQIKQKWETLYDFAKFCFPNGGIIRCLKCQIRRACTIEEIANWMKEGYPLCKKCGTKTSLE